MPGQILRSAAALHFISKHKWCLFKKQPIFNGLENSWLLSDAHITLEDNASSLCAYTMTSMVWTSYQSLVQVKPFSCQSKFLGLVGVKPRSSVKYGVVWWPVGSTLTWSSKYGQVWSISQTVARFSSNIEQCMNVTTKLSSKNVSWYQMMEFIEICGWKQ